MLRVAVLPEIEIVGDPVLRSPGATPTEYRRCAGLLREAVVNVDLEPLSLDETADYLRVGLADVGCQRTLFHDGATVRLHELTGGAIADLAIAAEVSLAVAASGGAHCKTIVLITAEEVDQASKKPLTYTGPGR